MVMLRRRAIEVEHRVAVEDAGVTEIDVGGPEGREPVAITKASAVTRLSAAPSD